MKVILLQDVARIGRRFEVKDVPDGHALNFLIPRKLAEPASRENVKNLEARKNKAAVTQAGAEEAFKATCEKLAQSGLTLALSANEKGHLFQGVKAEDIATHVSKEVGPLLPNQVVLDAPLKEVGEHTVTIVSGDEKGDFTLTITAA